MSAEDFSLFPAFQTIFAAFGALTPRSLAKFGCARYAQAHS